MPLHRIIYVSEAVGAAGTSLLSIAEILGVSERNNRRDHLTGVLLGHNGRFLQAIEGARTDLDRLMDRLSHDRRHVNLRLLSDRPIAARMFGHWAMGQATATPAMLDLLNDEDLSAISPAKAETVLAATAASLAEPA
ncbi:MAG: BLUF domain-containing protein [Candidatus Brevundimonas phytovorans]|nr:BLUF domain-containing protein [Brevundimonas sp.]WEK57641.1 MAG: BLUF domain-containing protein [Brevundimonas sp.]